MKKIAIICLLFIDGCVIVVDETGEGERVHYHDDNYHTETYTETSSYTDSDGNTQYTITQAIQSFTEWTSVSSKPPPQSFYSILFHNINNTNKPINQRVGLSTLYFFSFSPFPLSLVKVAWKHSHFFLLCIFPDQIHQGLEEEVIRRWTSLQCQTVWLLFHMSSLQTQIMPVSNISSKCVSVLHQPQLFLFIQFLHLI